MTQAKEYIEKIDNLFYARIGEVTIDNVKYFDSRVNYKGWGGPDVFVNIGDFSLQWDSNFGFGSFSSGGCSVVFKGIYVRNHADVWLTSQFVELLNTYSVIAESQKDDIILGLANMLAYYRVELEKGLNIINNWTYYRPKKELDILTNVRDSSNLGRLKKIMSENEALINEVEKLQLKIKEIGDIINDNKQN
jgi:hypothetical protein